MNTRLLRRHHRRHVAQTIGLLATLLGLLALTGWALAGSEGLLWTVALGAGVLLGAPRASSRLVLTARRARPLHPSEAPQLYRIVATLADRAGLPRVPTLYLLPTATPNAMATGSRDDPAIALTLGLVRRLPLREVAAILAHEISHLRYGDLWVLALAHTATAVLRLMTLVGSLLLLVNVPLVLAGQAVVPWGAVLVLLVGPTAAGLLVLALSRTREYHADLGAVQLTGDPLGLARALVQVEQHSVPWFARLLGVRPAQVPEALATHPSTAERVRRLMETATPPLAGAG